MEAKKSPRPNIKINTNILPSVRRMGSLAQSEIDPFKLGRENSDRGPNNELQSLFEHSPKNTEENRDVVDKLPSPVQRNSTQFRRHRTMNDRQTKK